MSAAKLNIYIEQNSDFNMTLYIKQNGQAIDLTGYQFKGQVRKTPSTRQLVAEMTFSLLDQTQLATMGGLLIQISGANTAKIPCDPSPTFERILTQYAFDLYSTSPSGQETRWVEGIATISPSATLVYPIPPGTGQSPNTTWGAGYD